MAQILEFLGVDNIVTLDLHAIAIQGSVTAKVCFEDHQAAFVAIDFFEKELGRGAELAVVAPDAGAAKRAKSFQMNMVERGFDASLAFMHKERMKANQVAEVFLIGDVKGKDCLIVDDMTDTAGTLCKAASELKQKGAKNVYAFITHGIFSGPAADRIRESDLTKIVATDSMIAPDFDQMVSKTGGKLVHVSVDLLVAEIIRRNHQNEGTKDLASCHTYKDL